MEIKPKTTELDHLRLANPNIVLIGMAGAGKSTVGAQLATQLKWPFIDTDLLVESRYGDNLQNLLISNGYLGLRNLEQQILLSLDKKNCVIATGGSAVYGILGISHLKKTSIIIYIKVSLATVKKRIGDYSQRGLAKAPGQSLESLFEERQALYAAAADITIDANELNINDVIQGIRDRTLGFIKIAPATKKP